jgi:hypothetical protein
MKTADISRFILPISMKFGHPGLDSNLAFVDRIIIAKEPERAMFERIP